MSGNDVHMPPVGTDLVLSLCELVLGSTHDVPVIYWTATDTASGASFDLSGPVERVMVGPAGRLVFHVAMRDGASVGVSADLVTDWGWE